MKGLDYMKAREKKSRAVKENIVNTARDLFTRQGYQQTTTRQIIEATNINNSTLYHFFRDKEDLFLSIIFDIYIKSIEIINKTMKNEDDGVFLYTLAKVVELKAVSKNHNVAQTFLDVYSSWRISEKVTKADIDRVKMFFKPFTKNFSEDDYYVRNLALRGMRLSFFAECVQRGGNNFEKRWPFLIATELQFLNVPKSDIKKTIEKIATVINKKSFTIFGVTI